MSAGTWRSSGMCDAVPACRKGILTWARPVLGLALLAIVLGMAPLGKVRDAIAGSDPALIGVALAVGFASILLSALKLHVLLGTGRRGRGPGVFTTPEGVEVRGDTLWISDSGNDRVVTYRLRMR